MTQIVVFVLYFVFCYDQAEMQPITDYRVFLVKLACCLLMHLTVSPHLKSSLQLFRYILYPISFEHRDSDRLLCCLVLSAKVLAATCSEVFLILVLSRIDEKGPYMMMQQLSGGNSLVVPQTVSPVDSTQVKDVLFNFLVYMCVMHVPILSLQWRSQGYVQMVQDHHEIFKSNRSMQRKEQLTQTMKGFGMGDCLISYSFMLFNEAYCALFAYSFFYVLIALQMAAW